AQSQRRPGRRSLAERRMKIPGEESRVRSNTCDEDCGYGTIDARILWVGCRYRNAQRSPLCSFARTAIEVPGCGNHVHQLGNPDRTESPTTHSSRSLPPASN